MTSVSLSLDLFLTQKREMDNYIPSGKSGRRFSRSSFSRRHLLDDDALFNPARFEKTRNASSSRKKMKTCLSLSLSVCLSLSRARRGKEEQTTRNKKASPQSRRLTAAQKKAISSNSRALSFETTRKEEEEDARERVLSLLRAVLRVKEIERCDFWFLPFVFVRLCLRVVSGERERESPMMMV